MTVDIISQYAAWLLFILAFLYTLAEAVRRPLRSNTDIALLFGAPALVILVGMATTFGIVAPNAVSSGLSVVFLLAIPFLLLRLVDDFSSVSRPVMRLAQGGLGVLAIGAFAFPLPRPMAYDLLAVLYFVGFQLYATSAFLKESRRSTSVTGRRMAAAAWASVLLGLAVLVLGLQAWLQLGQLGSTFFDVLSVGSALFYYIGFAPPLWLRRAWQRPELDAFLARSSALRRLSDLSTAIRELEQGVASALGGSHAGIGLWDEAARVLKFSGGGKEIAIPVDEESVASGAFLTQRSAFSFEYPRDGSTYAEMRQHYGSETVLAAPVSAGEKRIGVLIVTAARPSIFAQDDLALLQFLADHVAVILEDHNMIREVARIQAQEDAVRLRDEFLSAAAHDLKNPLTAILGHAQLMVRRAEREPAESANIQGLRRLESDAQRMRRLVDQLLDASRVEEGRLLGTRDTVDLAALAAEICERACLESHQIVLEAQEPVVGEFDRVRLEQLMDNLVSNAVKYSPEGGEVRVKVWIEGEEAHITVTDRGIGMPASDLPHIFDRFHRASNTSGRSMPGSGLGLFICRGITQEHGGHIWATSVLGEGSTFHVVLPTRRVYNSVLHATPEVGPHVPG